MLPMSSSNHHSHIEPSWKTYYDAKRLLRQTEQRLKEAREYHPHVHLNSHHESNDLSGLSSSSFLLHGDTSSIHAGNRSMLNDDRTGTNKHQSLDSEALQTIRRKINKQKVAAELRAEQLFHSQSDAGHVFESYHPHAAYSTSASLQNLHYSPYRQQRFSPPKPQPSYSSHLCQSQSFPSELDAVLRNTTSSKLIHKDTDLERPTIHEPITRKPTKMMSKDSYSLTNGRSIHTRSASASNSVTTKYQDLPSSQFLTSTDTHRFKHMARRAESGHAPSTSGIRTNLITSDTWQADSIVTKKASSILEQEKPSKKKTASEIISKRTKVDIEDSLGHANQRTDKILKPKRDTNTSRPPVILAEKTPLKTSLLKSKSDDENKKLEDLIQQKRQAHEDVLSNEKRLRDDQDKLRKDRYKRLNEPIKDASHQYLQTSTTKKTSVTPKDLAEHTRQHLLRLLGPSVDYRATNTFVPSSVLERCSSSSSSSSSSSMSSSNDSVIEMQPSKLHDPLNMRSRSEPPLQTGTINNNVQRHENLLRWANNLTRDCDIVENRFKYLRTNGTQPFDLPPSSSYQHLQHDDGNMRYSTLHYDSNASDLIKPSSITRISDRSNDYQGPSLSTLNDHRDLLADRRIYRDRAAAKIQAAYRGYTVRKSMPWLNEKEKYLDDKYNQRPTLHRETTTSINVDIRFKNESFPIDSTLLRYHENSSVNEYPSSTNRKLPTLPLYTDDYDGSVSAPILNLSTPVNQKQIPIINANTSLELPSANSSVTITPIPSPENHVPSQNGRRRSLSPPPTPQMSPDNGRPIQNLIPSTSQRSNDDISKSSKSSSRTQNPTANSAPQPPPPSSSSSSTTGTSSNRKRHSPSPQQATSTVAQPRHRSAQNSSPPTSSSESILTAREKRVRQKFNSDIELQAYEKRLKDIEKKIRQLVKRAFEIFDEKRISSSPSAVQRTTKIDSSTQVRSKASELLDDESSSIVEESIHKQETESIKNGSNNISSNSTLIRQSEATSDASDLERRVRAYRDQLKAKKLELERLKQRKNKEILRRQEDELKKQIESCDHEIETLRLQPTVQEQTVSVRSAESTCARLPKVHKDLKSPKQDVSNRDEEKEVDSRPLETPRDERDTQHDAQSISVATDIAADPESEQDSLRATIDRNEPLVDLNLKQSTLSQEKKDSTSSTSTTSEKQQIKSTSATVLSSPSPPPSSPSDEDDDVGSFLKVLKQQIKDDSNEEMIPQIDNKPSEPPASNKEYDVDFSEVSESSTANASVKTRTSDPHVESIKEEIIDKLSTHDTNQSVTSRSSTEEPSEILVIGKKSSNTDGQHKQSDMVNNEKLPPISSIPSKQESEDTSHDVSDDDYVPERNEQSQDNLVRTSMRKDSTLEKDDETSKSQRGLTKEASEWISAEDSPREDINKPSSPNNEEEMYNETPIILKENEVLERSDTTNGTNEDEELKIDLSPLGDYSSDDLPAVNVPNNNNEEAASHTGDSKSDNSTPATPKPAAVEPVIKPVVQHTRERVIRLCHEATKILFNQNEDFSNRSTINRTIPETYFHFEELEFTDELAERSNRAYCRMIFDLCVELLYEMYSSNFRTPKYPEWQKEKLLPKRFYRLHKPHSRQEAESFIQRKVLEILNLAPRQVILSKWRVPIERRYESEQFEIVLDEELRRTEPQWIDYDDDCLRIKFEMAEHIFDQLVQETLTECLNVIKNRLVLSSNSTGV